MWRRKLRRLSLPQRAGTMSGARRANAGWGTMSAEHSGLLEYLLHQTIGLQAESIYSV
jgi:hypothetical protein